ncbi:MAG: hypothetical protein KIT14_11620 [bacterium]|nr:hypothetical protein [bacterium]
MIRGVRAQLGTIARSLLVLVAGLLATTANAAVDGTWRRLQAPALEQHVIVDAGGGHVTLTIDVAGEPATFTGSVAGAFTLDAGGHPCLVRWDGLVLPGETLIDGQLTVACSHPDHTEASRLTLARCECDDENAAPGDGCDATCRVEPCWTCTGAPSVCTPLGDGAACDDRRDCTTGTTCQAGLCGGGAPVPACVDMNGVWTSSEDTGVDPPAVLDYDVEQRDGILVVRAGGLRYVGTIDTASGAFDASMPFGNPICPEQRIPFAGVADATSYTGNGLLALADPFACDGLPTTLTGTRQNPCAALPDGAACDDGNPCTDDDVCTGSSCGGFVVPDGTSCDDGNACTVDDTCSAGVCVGGPGEECGQCETCDVEVGCVPVADGTSCDDGDACNVGETCTAGTCGGGAPEVCGTCESCDTVAGCVVVPDGTSCDDGSACTTVDTCTGGTCSGPPLECGACRGCDPQDGCVAAPRPVCEAPTSNKVSLLARRLPVISSRPPTLVFKWKGGGGVALADLGLPTVDERYTLCVYDESGAKPKVLFTAAAPPGACGTDPCWMPTGSRGFRFKNRTGIGDGLVSLALRTGAPGKAAVLLKGKGSALAQRPDGMPAPGFALPLRVQLQGESGACFGARFTAATTQKNAAGLYKGKGTP